MAEVKMKNKEIALKLRHRFAVKRRAGGNFGRLWIANSVTLATRVRIDILRGMAKQFVGEDEIAYVNAYASRPILTLKKGLIPKTTCSHFCGCTIEVRQGNEG